MTCLCLCDHIITIHSLGSWLTIMHKKIQWESQEELQVTPAVKTFLTIHPPIVFAIGICTPAHTPQHMLQGPTHLPVLNNMCLWHSPAHSSHQQVSLAGLKLSLLLMSLSNEIFGQRPMHGVKTAVRHVKCSRNIILHHLVTELHHLVIEILVLSTVLTSGLSVMIYFKRVFESSFWNRSAIP